ncbi:restriction endonuclease subunit S [Staphylococcus hyicus]|uniref:restriction endonuclease subunit S n=1 Tax=Staphylococcus hyicus TaxID=1284 RepID=UPI0036D3F89B
MSREMKDSGIEWIGKIPEDWEVVKLGVVADISTGNTPKDPDNIKYSKSEGVDWLKTNNLLGVDGVSNSSLKIKEQYISEARLTNPRSVLITCIGDIGKLGYTSKPVAFNQQINSITFTKDIVYWKYGMYALYSQREQQESFANGNVLKILNRENQKKVVITVPKDINKQIKISNALDKICLYIRKLVDKTQLSIKELKKYKQSLITESVTKGLDSTVEMKDSGIEPMMNVPKHWKINKIKYLFELYRGLNITKKNLIDTGIPVINYGEIHSKYGFHFDLRYDVVQKVDSHYLEYKNSLINQGDFIFADTSEDIEGSGNFTCYLNEEMCFAGSHTIILKPKKFINYFYFSYLFESLLFRSQIQKKVEGIKVYSITQRILKSLILFEPPAKEQEQIVQYLDNKISTIDRLIEDKTKVIAELENYKKSLIYEYSTGKKEL